MLCQCLFTFFSLLADHHWKIKEGENIYRDQIKNHHFLPSTKIAYDNEDYGTLSYVKNTFNDPQVASAPFDDLDCLVDSYKCMTGMTIAATLKSKSCKSLIDFGFLFIIIFWGISPDLCFNSVQFDVIQCLF